NGNNSILDKNGNPLNGNPAPAQFGNGASGVFLNQSSHNTIGGTGPGDGNVISGNFASGIAISGSTGTTPGSPAAAGNMIQGNIVGLDLTQSFAIPNAVAGFILSDADNNTIGGDIGDPASTTPLGASNVIAGNRLYGVLVANGASGNVVSGNYI